MPDILIVKPVFAELADLAWTRFRTAVDEEGFEQEEAFKRTIYILLQAQEDRFLQLRGGVAS